VRILTSEPIAQSPTWRSQTEFLALSAEEDGDRWRLPRAVRNTIALAWAARSSDIVILTDVHGVSGNLFSMLLRLWPGRPTIIRADALFALPSRGPLRALKRMYIRAAMAGVDLMVVWSPAVVDRYCTILGLPRRKFASVRFHHTLTGFDVDRVIQGNYVFSGGDSMRDYPTLLQAVCGLEVPVVIAARRPLPTSVTVPPNVTIRATSEQEFRELMVGALLVVFPLRIGELRTSGQQSYLNAMALGKAVVVTDTVDAPFYVEDGRTGQLTPSGDALALRRTIMHLLAHPEKISALGEAARRAASTLDQEHTWTRVLTLAEATHRARGKPTR